MAYLDDWYAKMSKSVGGEKRATGSQGAREEGAARGIERPVVRFGPDFSQGGRELHGTAGAGEAGGAISI